MKYWLLTTEYPPAHGGGISTYCLYTARMLTMAGHEVTVFVNDEKLTGHHIQTASPGLRIIRFNPNRDGLQRSLGYTARLSYAFASIVKQIINGEGQPQIIEAQDYLGIAYYLTQFKHTGYAFLSHTKIVLTLHSPAFVYLEYNKADTWRFPDFWTGEMEKQAIRAADALISPTAFLVNEISRYMDLSSLPIRIIPNPYQYDDDKTPAPVVRKRIVYYGKLSAQKGSFRLLEYFKELWDGGFEHALHLVGGTDIVFHPDMKTMGQLVDQDYRKYIEQGLLYVHGKIHPAAISNHLAGAHVVLVPSLVDNMPYVVMEAMSRGKVVLASVQGGQQEMMTDGVSGFLFDHERPGDFQRKLQQILSLDDQTLYRIGIAAQQKVKEDYSFNKVCTQKLDWIHEILALPHQSPAFPFMHTEGSALSGNETGVRGLLSVVIPYFNMGQYIAACIDSIRKSNYQSIEIIIVNDGSTDTESLDQLTQLENKAAITVIHQRNQGLAATRNAGAKAATGEFLAFIDADDKVADSYYQKAIVALERYNNVYFAGAWAQYFENSQQVWVAFTPTAPYVLAHNMVNSSGLVYKKQAFLAAGLNDKSVGYGLEDYESVVHLLSKGYNGVVLPEPLFFYRVRTGSMFRNITEQKLLLANQYITEKHHAFYKKYAIQLLHLLNANGPGHLYDNPSFNIRVKVEQRHENSIVAALKGIVKKNERLKKLALAILKNRSK